MVKPILLLCVDNNTANFFRTNNAIVVVGKFCGYVLHCKKVCAYFDLEGCKTTNLLCLH